MQRGRARAARRATRRAVPGDPARRLYPSRSSHPPADSPNSPPTALTLTGTRPRRAVEASATGGRSASVPLHRRPRRGGTAARPQISDDRSRRPVTLQLHGDRPRPAATAKPTANRAPARTTGSGTGDGGVDSSADMNRRENRLRHCASSGHDLRGPESSSRLRSPATRLDSPKKAAGNTAQIAELAASGLDKPSWFRRHRLGGWRRPRLVAGHSALAPRPCDSTWDCGSAGYLRRRELAVRQAAPPRR